MRFDLSALRAEEARLCKLYCQCEDVEELDLLFGRIAVVQCLILAGPEYARNGALSAGAIETQKTALASRLGNVVCVLPRPR